MPSSRNLNRIGRRTVIAMGVLVVVAIVIWLGGW